MIRKAITIILAALAGCCALSAQSIVRKGTRAVEDSVAVVEIDSETSQVGNAAVVVELEADALVVADEVRQIGALCRTRPQRPLQHLQRGGAWFQQRLIALPQALQQRATRHAHNIHGSLAEFQPRCVCVHPGICFFQCFIMFVLSARVSFTVHAAESIAVPASCPATSPSSGAGTCRCGSFPPACCPCQACQCRFHHVSRHFQVSGAPEGCAVFSPWTPYFAVEPPLVEIAVGQLLGFSGGEF